MDPSMSFGPIRSHNAVAGTHVSGGTMNVTFSNSAAGLPPTPCRMMPFPKNEDVIDRGPIFAELGRLLPASSRSQSAALWGLGGSGKTQIALEYAYRRSDDPACSIFWVHANDRSTFTHDYKLIGTRLGLAGNLEGAELLAAVRGRIEANPCWLLVLDNADNLSLFGVGETPRHVLQGQSADETFNLNDFVPRGTAGTVLWTSRDGRIVGSLVGSRRGVEVAHMTDSEALLLLESVRDKTISNDEMPDAEELLRELGRLPLAISQAAAYMRRTSTPIRNYMSKLRSDRERWKLLLLKQFDRHRKQEVSNSVLETWGISVEHIRQENKMAYDILHSLAFLDNQNIPLELIHNIAESYKRESARGSDPDNQTSENESGDGSEDDEQIIEVATRLHEYSFLRLLASEQGRAYEMHNLVQEATRYSLSEKQAEEAHFSRVALHAICDLFPEPRRDHWHDCERYLVHAQRVGEWAELCQGEMEASTLLSRVSDYLHDRGRWREREPVVKRALKLRRKILGDRHRATMSSMADLAATYYGQGRYKKVEKLVAEVLKLRKEVLGDRHPNTIWSMADLVTTYYGQGRYKEAEELVAEVLKLRKEVLGDRHPDTIWSMTNLAATYHGQGRYKEAEELVAEVLKLRKEVLGDRHPNTIWSMADLVATYYGQGRYKEAEELNAELLKLRKEVLGDRHPDTIWSIANLAAIYYGQKRYKEAEELQTEVLKLRKEVLGDRHPETASSKHGLAITWYRQGRLGEALSMMEDCLRLRSEILGWDHPATQYSSQALDR